MSNPIAYELERIEDGENLMFTFLSNRKTQIVKAIRYSRMDIRAERPIYNLGFGNYDSASLDISDETIDNNGDPYTVFGTVLSSIPLFFDFRPLAGILVRGSDSHPGFAENCRLTCRKRCTLICKDAGRRIRLYCAYVNRHLDSISVSYIVYGVSREGDEYVAEAYDRTHLYPAILIYQRELPIFVP